ncbi:MAG: DNA polymerase IV [uncultured Rubrobacteraceae bacterium]|uniref:DNA polymerase IV n=1 Tax=uncultured Rubrobacteraceae bacterium TaxID=349277 RepID=A0A6J4R5C1_9ACTN|nr:MAG: DNA polymerase IV [uncultured Rubrobacteraceae bacterium]
MVQDHEPIRPPGYRFARRVEDHALYARVYARRLQPATPIVRLRYTDKIEQVHW